MNNTESRGRKPLSIAATGASAPGCHRASLLLALIAVLISMCGCQNSQPRPDTNISFNDTAASSPPGVALTPDQAVASDESASRLHDIVGAILSYYVQNHYRLPNFLEDIKPFADAGTQLNLISPSSGIPYIYSADGLFAAGQDKRIIVWDPKPNRAGVRWCILMPHMDPGHAIVPEVVGVPEKIFQGYLPAVQ